MVVSSEIKKLYPFASHFFETSHWEKGENSLHYLDEGEGEPILCLHGNPTWSFYFREIINSFRATHRVIVPDHLGCGLSGRPQAFSYQLADHIHNIVQLIEHLDLQNITLIVHDWGGAIGFGAALQTLPRIRRIVVINTAAFRSKDIPKRIASLKSGKLPDLLIRRLNLFCLPALYMTTTKGLSSAVKRAYMAPYSNYHDRIAISAFVKDIPTGPEHVSYATLQYIEEGLRHIDKPILLLWGAKDFCFHLGFLKRWQEFYPQARTVVLPKAGHYVLEDEPTAAIREIQMFVDSNAGKIK